jgi:hypothetical protein
MDPEGMTPKETQEWLTRTAAIVDRESFYEALPEQGQ